MAVAVQVDVVQTAWCAACGEPADVDLDEVEAVSEQLDEADDPDAAKLRVVDLAKRCACGCGAFDVILQLSLR